MKFTLIAVAAAIGRLPVSQGGFATSLPSDQQLWDCVKSSGFTQIGKATLNVVAPYTSGLFRELDGEDAATSSITGSVTIAGYPDGIDPSTGAVNGTLWVRYDLQGCNGTCSVLEVEDNTKFCDQVAIGELDPDNSDGDVDVVKNVNPTANDTETIDVNTTINKLFDRPMVVEDADGRVLACAMFKEITNNTDSDASASAEEIPVNDKTPSGAMGSAASAAWFFFVATTVVVAAVSF